MDTQVAIRSMKLSNWARLIKDCHDSGLSVQQWLNQHGISKHQYYYWYHKVKDAAVVTQTASFCELKPPAEIQEISVPVSDPASAVTITSGNFTISVKDVSSREILRMVLEELANVK